MFKGGVVGNAFVLLASFLGYAAFADVVYERLKSFGFPDQLGHNPMAGLVRGRAGVLYGTTVTGGLITGGAGVVYAVNENGTGYRILHAFTGGGTNLGNSQAAGGSTNRSQYGTIFALNEDGSGYAVLHRFNGADGLSPRGDLIRVSTGVLFGTTLIGGASNRGVIFRINENGSGFDVVHHFAGSPGDGVRPTAGLTAGHDGYLYGTTIAGGTNSGGAIFKFRDDGTEYRVLAHLPPGGVVNEDKVSTLAFGSDGFLYGTKRSGGSDGVGFIFKVDPDGSRVEIVRNFSRYGGDGQTPAARITRAADGFFYGSTVGGGANNAGAIFRFAEDPFSYVLIHSFTTNEGSAPRALAEAVPGVLFGAASGGGQSNKGTIFRLNMDGSEFSVLHHFAGGAGGEQPVAGLTLGRDGVLYGTTARTIFRINTDGSAFQTIYSFCCGPPGATLSPLVQGDDGALYGAYPFFGQFNRGTVFKIGTNGLGFQVLHDFPNDGSEGGGFPWAGLVIGPDRRLYGSTAAGSSGPGALFAMNQDGTQFAVLHTFSLGEGGRNPLGELLVGHDGALYGVTQFGGTFGGQGVWFSRSTLTATDSRSCTVSPSRLDPRVPGPPRGWWKGMTTGCTA